MTPNIEAQDEKRMATTVFVARPRVSSAGCQGPKLGEPGVAQTTRALAPPELTR